MSKCAFADKKFRGYPQFLFGTCCIMRIVALVRCCLNILTSGVTSAVGVPYSLFGESWVGLETYDFSPIDRQIELFMKAYTVLSLEELVESHSAALPSVECQEEALISSVVIGELRKALSTWNIWGTEVLEMYLSGKRCMVAKFLMDNYGFSRRTAFRKKNEFEKFSKDFLSEWHY